MATFIESVLPSGKGIRVEKLSTKQYRLAQNRVVERFGEGSSTKLSMSLVHEMLLCAFRGITASPLEWVEKKDGTPDVDKMLEAVPAHAWITPTYEDLIIMDGPRSLEALLDDASDYSAATNLVQTATFANREKAGYLAGKTRLVSEGP